MSLTKVTYVDGETKIYADNMNDIQDEIISASDNLSDLSDEISSLSDRIDTLAAIGTEGTPIATKSAVSNYSVSITPSVTNTEGYISGGTHTGTAVNVSASELVSGTLSVSSAGTKDVTNYASASIPSGTAGTPTATKGAVSNHSVNITPSVTNASGFISGGTHTGETVSVTASELVSGTLEITEDGTFDVTNYSSVSVPEGEEGLPTATKSPVQDHSVTITPSVTNVEGYIDGGTHTGTAVSVNASELVSGTFDITRSGTFDITNYEFVTTEQIEPASNNHINFIDYDGTVLHSYTPDEWENVSSLPANPTHTGLVAQGWNWTKAQIDAQLTAIPDGDIWVGQMYITESGDTEIDITLESEHLSPYLTIAVNGSVTVDWGDNSSTTTVTGTSDSTLTYTLHEYTLAGDYTISIHVNTGELSFMTQGDNYTGVLSNKTYDRSYSNSVLVIRLGRNAKIYTRAFQGCGSLQFVTVPNDVTYIGVRAFCQCYSLKSLTIPNSVTSLYDSFVSNCTSLQSIAVQPIAYSVSSYAFYNCSSLQSITIPASVTTIWYYAFERCYALRSITIPDGVTLIGMDAFSYCYLLKSITIPDGVTSIGNYAFSNCSSLQSIIIPDGVTSIGIYAFRGCSLLQSVAIPDSVTSIGNYTFQNCFSLQSVIIPDSVTSIGTYAFEYCYSLQSVTIPDGVTSIGAYAFRGCQSLRFIIIPDGMTSIDNYAFTNCTALRYIMIPDGVTSIGNYAFSNCSSLQSIIIPDGVTSIGNSAFSGCYSLQSITIPDGVTAIGTNAFQNCYGMEEYYLLPTTPPTLGTNAFVGIPTGIIIYVPQGCLEAYQTATNWSTYASYMQEFAPMI